MEGCDFNQNYNSQTASLYKYQNKLQCTPDILAETHPKGKFIKKPGLQCRRSMHSSASKRC